MRPTMALGMFRATPRMMHPVPKEDQAAHTVSQRLRKVKRIPPELYPLGVVVIFGLGFAIFSSARHFMTDSTIRFSRKGSSHQVHPNAPHDDHHEKH